MLGLFGKKSDHPMADLKSAQALLEDLPKSDALKTLQELTTWVESVREQAEFRLDHQLAVLRLLDETARPFERKLMREYFAANTLSTFQENRLWMALNEFFGQVAQAYFNVLTRYRNGDKGGSAIKPVLPLVAARGICAVAGRLKCAAARYALADPAIWGYLAEFYAHAETQQYLDEQVSLYAGLSASTTVRCEFAGVLVWYASCAGTLSRIHTHLAERLAAHLCKNFTVSAQYGPDSLFGFDLLQHAPPMRVKAENTLQPSLRFLGMNNIQPHVEALLKTLEKNIVPEAINLGGTYEADAVREVVRHLSVCWAPPPPVRRNVRHNIKVNLNVANGFSKVMEQTDIGLNFGDGSSMTWEVEDISTGGFRCVLPASRVDGIAIGLLVGIKPENIDHWGVGIVRRLRRDQQNNLHVGVEILANQMTAVGLREHSAGEEQPALWLNSPGDDSGEARLLMSPDTFSSSRSLHVRLAGKNYLLMPLELVGKGADYDLARYRRIEEDTSSDAAY
ncbi:MAG: hypothetical protein HY937_08170 [Nitrosomonadales bacterium]|nr:hypothetical protein [Nitrosomonadales bacterium]